MSAIPLRRRGICTGFGGLDRRPHGLAGRIACWLRPGGWLLATVGHNAWTGTDDNWLDGPAAMWWSHADAATYESWLHQANLTITSQGFIPEGAGGHTLFWAQQPPN